jgi:hypothetical protein
MNLPSIFQFPSENLQQQLQHLEGNEDDNDSHPFDVHDHVAIERSTTTAVCISQILQFLFNNDITTDGSFRFLANVQRM